MFSHYLFRRRESSGAAFPIKSVVHIESQYPSHDSLLMNHITRFVILVRRKIMAIPNKKSTPCGSISAEPQGVVAEKERFELSNGFTRYTISSRAPSTKLGDFSMSQALLVNGHYITINLSLRQALFSVLQSFSRSSRFLPNRLQDGSWPS